MTMVDLVLKGRFNREVGSKQFNASNQKFKISMGLLEEIENKIKSRKFIQEARKQFVISSITVFEVYFKDRFLRLLEIFGNDKIIKKRITDDFKEKFDIADIDRIITEKISVNEIIASRYNFQKLEDIDKAFSPIFNVRIFDELKHRKFKIQGSKSSPFKINKNFYKEFKSMIELRHDFVHDINFDKNITKTRLVNYEINFMYFLAAFDVLFTEKLNEETRRLKEKASLRKKQY